MADKGKKLFDIDAAGVGESTPDVLGSEGNELLTDIERLKKNRLDALNNTESYRERLRLEREEREQRKKGERERKQSAATLEREARLRCEIEEEALHTKDKTDRVRELLERIEKSGEQQGGGYPSTDNAVVGESKEERFLPEEEAGESMAYACAEPDLSCDNVIHVDMDIKKEVLHIEGISLGNVTLGAPTSVLEATAGRGVVLSADSAGGVNKEARNYPEPEADALDYEFITHKARAEKASVGTAEYEKELLYGNTRSARYQHDTTEDMGDLYINGEFDTSSQYPEPEGRLIKRGRVGYTAYDTATDLEILNRTKAPAVVYPDPEAPESIELAMVVDDTLEEPLPDVPKNTAPLTRKQRREMARAMREIEREDMLRFEKELRAGVREIDGVKSREDSVSDIDVPGTIYPDPDDTYEDPVLYHDLAPVSKKERNAEMLRYSDAYGEQIDAHLKVEDAPPFNKKALKKLVKQSRALDMLVIEKAHDSRIRELRLELQSAKLRFNRKKDKEGRCAREIQRDIAKLEKKQRRALIAEGKMNDRFYAPVLTDYSLTKLKSGANRELLLKKRVDLLDELKRRDEINVELLKLYTGKDEGKREHFEARAEAEMKAKRRAYRRQRGLDRAIVKYHISHSFSKRLYALMDEYVELCGAVSRLEYSLRHEKLLRPVKRDMKKERKKLKRKLARVSDHIDYYEKRAIDEAEDRRVLKRKMIIGWAVLIAIAVLGICAWAFWEPLVQYIESIYSGGV